MALQPSTIGRYQVRSRLGQGGMGVVYLASDPAINRLVAIKLLRINSDEMRARFQREARVIGALQHPNIVTVYDFGDHDGQPYIAMEYVPGETIGEVIQRRAPWSSAKKLEMIRQLCDGLEFAHRGGLVHRDVKPTNLIVSPDDVLKILDFGIARMADASVTLTGAVIGTPSYMSPEQVQAKPIDHRSDIFAVGLVLYELVSYRKAFPGKNQVQILEDVVHRDPPPLTDMAGTVDPGLISIVNRSLQKQPERRYQSLKDLKAELVDVIRRVEASGKDDTVQLGVRPEPPPGATPPERRMGQTGATPSRTSRDEIARRRAQQIATHLETAKRAFENGELEAALEAADQAALLDPDDPRTLGMLDQVRNAIDARQVAGLLEQAHQRLAASELTAALTFLADARQVLPSSPDVIECERLLTNAVEARDAERARQRAIADAMARAQHAFQSGALESALRSVAEALAHDPERPEALHLQQTVSAALEKRHLAEAREKAARDSIALAEAEFAEGKHEAALERLHQAEPHELVAGATAELSARFAEIQEQRRREAEEAARRAEAERLRREQWILDRTNAATVARDEGDYDAAIQILRVALAEDGTVATFTSLLTETEELREEAARRVEIERLAAETRAALEEEDVKLAGARLEALRQFDPSYEDLTLLDQRLQTLADTLAERRRRAEHERLAGEAIAAARRVFTGGQHAAAITQLERFSPSHPSVDRAIAGLRAEAERIRQARLAQEEAKRQAEQRALEEWVVSSLDEGQRALVDERPDDAQAILAKVEERAPGEARLDALRDGIAECRRMLEARERARFEEWVVSSLDEGRRALAAERPDDAQAILAKVEERAPGEARLDALRDGIAECRRMLEARERARWLAAQVARIDEHLQANKFDDAAALLAEIRAGASDEPSLKPIEKRIKAERKRFERRQNELWLADRVGEFEAFLGQQVFDAAHDIVEAIGQRMPAQPRLEELERRLAEAKAEAALRAHAAWCSARAEEIRRLISTENEIEAKASLDEFRSKAPEYDGMPAIAKAVEQLSLTLRRREEVARHVSEARRALQSGDLAVGGNEIAAARALDAGNSQLTDLQAELDRQTEAARVARERAELQARAESAVRLAKEHWDAGREPQALAVLEQFSPPHALVDATLLDLRQRLVTREEERLQRERERRRQEEEAAAQQKAELQRELHGVVARASKAMRRHRLKDAEELIADVLSRDPEQTEALALRREIDQLRRDAQDATIIDPQTQRVREAIVEAFREFGAGNHDVALARLESFEPKNRAVDKTLEDLRAEKRRLDEVARPVDDRAAEAVSHARALVGEGAVREAIDRLQRFSPAHPLVDQAIAEIRDDFSAQQIVLVQEALASADFQSALDTIEGLEHAGALRPELSSLKASARAGLDAARAHAQAEAAMQEARRFLRLRKFDQARTSLAPVLQLQAEHEAAAALQGEIDRADRVDSLVRSARQSVSVAEALKLLREALALDPAHEEASALLRQRMTPPDPPPVAVSEKPPEDWEDQTIRVPREAISPPEHVTQGASSVWRGARTALLPLVQRRELQLGVLFAVLLLAGVVFAARRSPVPVELPPSKGRPDIELPAPQPPPPPPTEQRFDAPEEKPPAPPDPIETALRRVTFLVRKKKLEQAAYMIGELNTTYGADDRIAAAATDVVAQVRARVRTERAAAVAAHAESQGDFAKADSLDAAASRLAVPGQVADVVHKLGLAETYYAQARRAAASVPRPR
jgi:hypothetical protein